MSAGAARAVRGPVPNGTLPARSPTVPPPRAPSFITFLRSPLERDKSTTGEGVSSKSRDMRSIVDMSCQLPVLSIVRTIKYPETTEPMRRPCACNATVGDYHEALAMKIVA
jgi:hypothetical protein